MLLPVNQPLPNNNRAPTHWFLRLGLGGWREILANTGFYALFYAGGLVLLVRRGLHLRERFDAWQEG